MLEICGKISKFLSKNYMFISCSFHVNKKELMQQIQFNFIIISTPRKSSKIVASFYKFYVCDQTQMKILKTKISMKFLILLLLLQIRYTFTALMKALKNCEKNQI